MSRRFVPPAVATLLASCSKADGELREVHASSYAEGHAEGLRIGRDAGHEEGRRAAEQAQQPALAATASELARLRAGADVATALARVLEQRALDRAEMDRTLRDTVAAALAVLVPALLATTAGREAAALIATTLAERAAERLTLAAHPDTLATLSCSGLPEGFEQRVTQQPDPAAGPGALTITWAGGGLVHDPAALLERVLRTIRPPGSPAEPEPTPERAEATR